MHDLSIVDHDDSLTNEGLEGSGHDREETQMARARIPNFSGFQKLVVYHFFSNAPESFIRIRSAIVGIPKAAREIRMISFKLVLTI